jgi:hypothetical protein
MIRMLVLATLIAGFAGPLAACSTNDGAEGNPWYSQGDATYDTIKQATDACRATGGTFQLKKGGEPTHMGDYECVMPPATGAH